MNKKIKELTAKLKEAAIECSFLDEVSVFPGHLLALIEALEAAEKQNSELEQYRTAFTEFHNKTEWVQKDRRFDVVVPWGKHRADVLREYIEHLEMRLTTDMRPSSNHHLLCPNIKERAELESFITGFLSDPAHDDKSINSMTAKVFRIALAALASEELEAFYMHDAPIIDGQITAHSQPGSSTCHMKDTVTDESI